MLLLAECLFYLSQYIDRSRRLEDLSIASLVPIFFIFPLIYLALYSQLPSPTADNTASILQILIFIHFVRLINEQFTSSDVVSEIVFILILSAMTITVKLSSLVYALSVCLVLLVIHRKTLALGGSPKQASSSLIKLTAMPVLIILVWSLRGILLSGCPAYPSTIGCIHVPWAVPIESVRSDANWIYSWARLPNHKPEDVLNSWSWVKPWFHNLIAGNPFTVDYPVVIFIVTLVVSFALYLHARLRRKANGLPFVILVPVLAGLAFWFFTAPDPRLASSLFWILPVSSTIIVLKILAESGTLKTRFVMLALFILSANVVLEFIFYPYMRGSTEGYMQFQVANLVERRTVSGLEVLVPAKGDQCWDSQLPCTPYFNDRLNFVERKYFPEFTVERSEN
jgi:hypothetical protein